MTLITRFFGQKVEGEALRSLVEALGRNPEGILSTPNPVWSTAKAEGRCRFSPTAEGVKVDLYVRREDFHRVDGKEPLDFTYGETGKVKVSSNYIGSTSTTHLEGTIPYNQNGRTQ